MKIAVTGPRGRLGSELVRQGCLPLPVVDLSDYVLLSRAILEMLPEAIIHCAALTDVDACELSPARAAAVNTGLVFGLGQIYPGKIVYISTDYVFDGVNGPYREESRPNPISVYGWSKLGGEVVLRNRREAGDLVVRTTILYDRRTTNFVTAVARRLQHGKLVELPTNLWGSPTHIPTLARNLIRAIELGLNGILNLAGSRVMSRYEIGQVIADCLEVDPDRVQPGPVTGTAPRPRQAGLVVEKAAKLGLEIGDPLSEIREVIYGLETVASG